MPILLIVLFFILVPLVEDWWGQNEEEKNVNALVKASQGKKEKRRKYTWQSLGTGNSAGK